MCVKTRTQLPADTDSNPGLASASLRWWSKPLSPRETLGLLEKIRVPVLWGPQSVSRSTNQNLQELLKECMSKYKLEPSCVWMCDWRLPGASGGERRDLPTNRKFGRGWVGGWEGDNEGCLR